MQHMAKRKRGVLGRVKKTFSPNFTCLHMEMGRTHRTEEYLESASEINEMVTFKQKLPVLLG